MDDIADNQQNKGILQRCACEHKEERQAQHHAGNGIGYQGHPFDHAFQLLIYGASGCQKRGTVGYQRPQHGSDNRYQQGVLIYAEEVRVIEYIPEMFQ